MNLASPRWEWAEVLRATSGQIISGAPIAPLVGVSTDTRSLAPGNLFIALRGERYDGHDFVEEALARGASGALVEQRWAHGRRLVLSRPGAIAQVAGTMEALGQLAAYHRCRCSMRVIGIAGSNGKTTTKELLARLLATTFRTVKSPKSYNNRIGVPLTILQCNADTEILVLELETNQLGGIRELCRIAQPWMGIVTNIGETHLETLGSCEGVARERQELIEALPEDGVAILNADDPLVLRMRCACRARTLRTYGVDAGELRAVAVEPESGLGLRVRLNDQRLLRCPAPGRHNVYNLLAAVTAADMLGVQPNRVAQSLRSFTLPPMRWEVHRLGEATLINDAYNANPQSMRATVATFCEQPATRRIAVLGGMRELGEQTKALHQELGRWLANMPLDCLLAVGPLAKGLTDGTREGGAAFPIEECAEVDSAIERLRATLRPGDVILLKGSRMEELERIANSLLRDRDSALVDHGK